MLPKYAIRFFWLEIKRCLPSPPPDVTHPFDSKVSRHFIVHPWFSPKGPFPCLSAASRALAVASSSSRAARNLTSPTCPAPGVGVRTYVGDVRLLAARGEEEATARAREAADKRGNGPWGENKGGTTKRRLTFETNGCVTSGGGRGETTFEC